MAVDEGYAFVSPKGAATAKALLDAAEALGLDATVVRSTMGGYYVPTAVSKRYETDALGAKPDEAPEEGEPDEPTYTQEGPPDPSGTEEPGTPDETWTVAEIKEWAQAHEVDLGDATKKADILAAIRTADKEE